MRSTKKQMRKVRTTSEHKAAGRTPCFRVERLRFPCHCPFDFYASRFVGAISLNPLYTYMLPKKCMLMRKHVLRGEESNDFGQHRRFQVL